MKIRIQNERLVVRGFWRVRFSASSDEIVQLRFLASKTYYGPRPRFLGKFMERFVGAKLYLRAVIVWTSERGIVLSAVRDSGFNDALDWFRKKGWDADEGIKLAFKTPLVRTTVPRI